MRVLAQKTVTHNKQRLRQGLVYEFSDYEAKQLIGTGAVIPVPEMPSKPFKNENITYITPYAVNKMYGAEINREVAKCNKEDWICLRDQDTLILTKFFGHEVYKLTQMYPDAGVIGALCNNVGRGRMTWHYHKGKVNKNPDIDYHTKIAYQLESEKSGQVKESPREVAGFFLLFRKIAWEHVGGFQDGLIRPAYFDANFCFRLMNKGLKIYVAQSLYLYHRYRDDREDEMDTNHLI